MRFVAGEVESLERWPWLSKFGPAGPLRFLWGALLLHALAAWGLHHVGPRQHEINRQERQLTATVRMTKQVRTEQRVQDLEQIKKLLEQSRASAKANAAAPEPVQFSATSLPKQPEELLKQARDLAESIDRIDKDNQAEELARMLKISEQEARAKLAEEAPATPPPSPAPAAQPEADVAAAAAGKVDSAAAEIAQLEDKARAALKRRQDQLARQGSGVGIDGAGGGKGQGQQQGQGQGQGNGQGDGQGDGQGNGQGRGNGDSAQQIAAFLDRSIPHPNTQRTSFWGRGVFDNSPGAIPSLDPGPLHKGAGRMIGSGGQYATRIYLNSWYVIGPFEGRRGRGLFATAAHPPEQSVMLDAVYRGKGERLLKWRYMTGASYPFIPPDVADEAVYYGYTELVSDRAQDVEMWVGADDDAKVWVNDKLIWAKGNHAKEWFFGTAYASAESLGRELNMNEGKQTVHLNQGRNKFFFKLSNGPDRVFISVVLTKKS